VLAKWRISEQQAYNKQYGSQHDGTCSVLCLNAVYLNVFDLLGTPSVGRVNSRVVKESGLVCVSYGKDNDDKVFVRKQIEAGVDAVIVDSVLAIRNELTNGVQNGVDRI
jgi:hypothetical protein